MRQSLPNIVLVTCHDLGRFLGCYGVGTVHSPHIDALAADGVRFARAFCTAPQCSPSRASLFTGRYPHSNGVMGLTHDDFGWDLHPDERHLGQILRDHGYRTALVGVHHESRRLEPPRVAARCGMDAFVPAGPGEAVTDRALEQLADAAASGRPFYLQVGYHEPHRKRARVRAEPDYTGFLGDDLSPEDASGVTVPPYLRDTAGTRAEIAELQGAVRYVDAAIGRLLADLRERGLEDDTLVVLTTDHGIALPRAKCAVYDPGIATALILRLPAWGWRGGRVHDELISNVDPFPTVLELLGLPVDARVQGRSFLSLLDGRDYRPREHVFAEMTYHDYYDPRRAVRTERHKLIVNFTSAPGFMDPSQSWRPRATPIAPRGTHPPLELYDLDTDPGELENLVGDPAHADVRRELLAWLHAFLRDTGDPLLDGAVTSPLHRRAVAALTGTGDAVA